MKLYFKVTLSFTESLIFMQKIKVILNVSFHFSHASIELIVENI